MKIVFIGDSFTRGFGVRRNESSVPSLLEKETKKILVNKGINGDTTSGMLARLHRDGGAGKAGLHIHRGRRE